MSLISKTKCIYIITTSGNIFFILFYFHQNILPYIWVGWDFVTVFYRYNFLWSAVCFWGRKGCAQRVFRCQPLEPWCRLAGSIWD
jgi:hypothetical protein